LSYGLAVNLPAGRLEIDFTPNKAAFDAAFSKKK
jgi:hypothetical protein